MTVLDRLRGNTVANMTEAAEHLPSAEVLAEQLNVAQSNMALLLESVHDQLERDNEGWLRADEFATNGDFTHAGLVRIGARARLNFLANPLIRRAVNIRTFYTWGQGVEISCADDNVNDVLQAFIDDPMNQQVLFSHDARQEKDQALQLDGNLMFSPFTSPLTGRCQLRTIPWQQVGTDGVICNPHDREERWFYLRDAVEMRLNPTTGVVERTEVLTAHPDISYRPAPGARLSQITLNGRAYPVLWDAPILHLRAGGLEGSTHGVSETYAALGWARLYKGFLEDWASIAKALSRLAWKGKTKASRVTALRDGFEGAAAAQDGPLPPRRQSSDPRALITDSETDLTPISKTGATLDADSGRPLAMMVGAAMDIPYTMLLGDADMGNLATAKTLDRPTELAMQSRRESWASAIRTLCDYVIDQAVRAPRGPLSGTVARDPLTGVETVVVAGDMDRTVTVNWPSLLEHDVAELVTAIVAADSTNMLPPEVVIRLLLSALGVDDIDEILEGMRGEDGNIIDPSAAADAAAAAAAQRLADQGGPVPPKQAPPDPEA